MKYTFNNEKEDVLDDSIKAQWSVEPRFVMEMCDLQGPMSATRGRTPSMGAVASEATAAASPLAQDNGFGTTVTVIVGNKEANLKSSLKKPRQQPPQGRPQASPEEDEGFIDEASSDPPTKKTVQFKTQVEEIPLLEPQSKAAAASVLPPLPSAADSPIKMGRKDQASSRKKENQRGPRKPRQQASPSRHPRPQSLIEEIEMVNC